MFRHTVISRMKATALATLAAAALMPAVSMQVQADDFYNPPSALQDLEPGDVIRSRPSEAGPPGARAMADAWQIMYRSSNSVGEPIAVTGTVLVPKQSNLAPLPVIALNPGTAGPAFRCAPSRMMNKGAYYEQPAVNDMLERGYAVVVTDYEGYKPEPETTYMVGPSMGAAVLDGIRAAQRLEAAGISPEAPVIVRGYSQGGGASLWAGQMHPSYAPELNLTAIAAGGVPANLASVAVPLNGTDGFGVLLYALMGQDAEFEELSLQPYANELGAETLATMNQNSCILSLLQDFAGLTLDDLFDPNPLTAPRLARIEESRLGREPVQVPVYQYHEEQDGLVAPRQAEVLRDEYCSQGVTHTWETFDTAGRNGVIRHINLVYQGNDSVNAFIEARLAGEPATSNCNL